jgi:hypothetical protein
MSFDAEKMTNSINTHFERFKNEISEKLRQSGASTDVIQYISEYSFPELDYDEYTKRKRVKNVIPFHEKCIAKRANGEQCSRRKKKDGNFCGTHSKACPHGVVEMESDTNEEALGSLNVVKKHIEVWLEDINGIMYWINDSGKVYHPDDIRNNLENPRVIAHYDKNEADEYRIIGEIH